MEEEEGGGGWLGVVEMESAHGVGGWEGGRGRGVNEREQRLQTSIFSSWSIFNLIRNKIEEIFHFIFYKFNFLSRRLKVSFFFHQCDITCIT